MSGRFNLSARTGKRGGAAKKTAAAPTPKAVAAKPAAAASTTTPVGRSYTREQVSALVKDYSELPKAQWASVQPGDLVRYVDVNNKFRVGGYVVSNKPTQNPQFKGQYILSMRSQVGQKKGWYVPHNRLKILYVKRGAQQAPPTRMVTPMGMRQAAPMAMRQVAPMGVAPAFGMPPQMSGSAMQYFQAMAQRMSAMETRLNAMEMYMRGGSMGGRR